MSGLQRIELVAPDVVFEGHCALDPSGGFILDSLRRTEKGAQRRAHRPWRPWSYLQRHGYRVVRVRIERLPELATEEHGR